MSQNGETVYKNCFGTVSPEGGDCVKEDTIFRIASMSKPITAAMLYLVDQGLIALDDPIAKYLPQYKGIHVTKVENGQLVDMGEAKTPVTISMLLDHTAGVSAGDEPLMTAAMTEEDRSTLQGTVDYFSKVGLYFEPRSTWGLGVRVITSEAYGRLPVGTYGWSGAFGSHFWVDPVNQITAVFMKNSYFDGGADNNSANRFEQAVHDSMED